MSIKIQCPACGQRTGINDRFAGRATRCPGCDTEIMVPSFAQIADARQKKRDAERKDSLANAEPIPWAAAIPVAKKAVPGPAEDQGFEPLPIGNRKNREETEMDMTPMVDVTFLLLIFFMVTASFSLQKSVPLPSQKSDAPSPVTVEQEEDEMDLVTLQVEESGVYTVFAAEWQKEVAGKLSLIGTLKDAKQSLPGQVRLAIECHEAAQLQMLIDALDAGALCEYNEFQVTHVDGF